MLYRFLSDDFSVRLPWFYFDSNVAVRKPDRVWSFEVNGLTKLPPVTYDLRFLVAPDMHTLEFSWDGHTFQTLRCQGGQVDFVSAFIDHFMIRCYWMDSGAESAPPVREVLLTSPGAGFPESCGHVPPYDLYRRETLVEQRAILRDWDRVHRILCGPSIKTDELREMVREIARWSATRQVTNEHDIHRGAIYSEEDKYDFQDAAAAAVVFDRMHAWTGQTEWRKRTLLAKQYVYKGQHTDQGNPVRFGGFPSMRSFETNNDTRLSHPLPAVNGVATCIIANLLVTLFEGGLEPEHSDVEALRRIAAWLVNNEPHPGVFRHHEGDDRGAHGHGDCQNSNALGASALYRIRAFLASRAEQVPTSWTEAATRGVHRVLGGQEAIGHWPYLRATIGRGQQYAEHSVPDHGMGLYHLLRAIEREPFQTDPRVLDELRRAACWYLCVCDLDDNDQTINLTFDPNVRGLAFSSFVWCRFMAAASLFRIARLIAEPHPWTDLALHLMATVRKRYWNHTDPHRAPVQASCIPGLEPVTWIQAAEWDAVLLLEIIDAM